MIANTSTQLRLIALARTASSNTADRRVIDLPIPAWSERDGRLWPVVVAALDPTDVLRIFDVDMKVWFALDGRMFRTYAEASAEAWMPSEPSPEPIREVLAVPSIGEPHDSWGIDQQPKAWR